MSEEHHTVTKSGLQYDISKRQSLSNNPAPYAVGIASRQMPTDVAKLAFEMIIKWGMITANTDGEDSAGRSKCRPLTPDEVVQRAFETAEAAFDVAKRRGHMVELPTVFADAEDDAGN